MVTGLMLEHTATVRVVQELAIVGDVTEEDLAFRRQPHPTLQPASPRPKALQLRFDTKQSVKSTVVALILER